MYIQVTSLASEYDNIVIYCARGGMRSGSVCNLFASLGMSIYKLEGGYKAYRNYVLEYLDNTYKNKDQLEKELGIPVLGAIPDIESI